MFVFVPEVPQIQAAANMSRIFEGEFFQQPMQKVNPFPAWLAVDYERVCIQTHFYGDQPKG